MYGCVCVCVCVCMCACLLKSIYIYLLLFLIGFSLGRREGSGILHAVVETARQKKKIDTHGYEGQRSILGAINHSWVDDTKEERETPVVGRVQRKGEPL